MNRISRIVSFLLLAAAAVTAAAQTVATTASTQRAAASAAGKMAATIDIALLLDDKLQDAANNHLIDDRALVLALAETDARAKGIDPSAEINRRRTDIQMGTTSEAPHATSILEKPGIADLLSLALDRGLITKAPAGTGLTLSTTPYAVWTAFGARDTPQLWQSSKIARNLSFSATFSSTDVTTTGDFSSFTSGEVKYVIAGNRSPRDLALLRGLRANLGGAFNDADKILDDNCSGLLNDSLNTARTEINTWLQANRTATVAEVRAKVDKEVEGVTVEATSLQQCVDAILTGEQKIQGGLDSMTTATRDYLSKKDPKQFSVATLFVRDETISDYYGAKLLFGYDRKALTWNANAQASWNKNSRTAAGAAIRSLRSYSVELGLTSTTVARGRLDGSISTKAFRDEAVDAKSVVIGEAKLNLHLTNDLRLPVSVTYANRETEKIKHGWQLNVGINALLDDVMRRLK